MLRRPRIELLWLSLVPAACVCCRACRRRAAARETALLVQPKISETEEWTPETLERMMRRQVALSLQRRSPQTEQPCPRSSSGPKSPRRFYYEDDPQFARRTSTASRA